MIYEVEGDILLTECEVIAHGIAPNDSFSSGLALSLRENWPAMYKDFRHLFHTEHPSSGNLFLWPAPNGKKIVNLFTQEAARDHSQHPGRATVEYVNHSLRELKKVAEKEKFTSIALPRLATGVGKLPWEDVRPLVVQHLGELKIPVEIYTTYKKGVKAEKLWK